MRIRKPLTASVAGLVGGALVAAVALAGDVTHDRLVNSEAEPENWINHHGNYESHRFSSLDEINRDNVQDLRVAFTWAMGDTQGGGDELIVWPFSGLEGTPIAEDGFLYLTTGWGVVTKLDVRSGGPRMVWKYDPKADRDYAPTVTCCGINNRGAVLYADLVISPVIDGRTSPWTRTTAVWCGKPRSPTPATPRSSPARR